MNMQEYLKNRVAFPLGELAKHRGEWVAWSPDGTRLVATSRDPDALDDLVRAAGEDPEDCVVEGLPDAYRMPQFRILLADQDIADVVNFIRTSWGNQAAPVTAAQAAIHGTDAGNKGRP